MIYKRIFSNFIHSSLIFALLFSSCTEEEMLIKDIIEEDVTDNMTNDTILEVEQKVDSTLLGEWINTNIPSGFKLESDGTLKYLKIDQINGKAEIDSDFVDEVRALDGKFEYLLTNNCFSTLDSTYLIVNDTLTIPIDTGLSGVFGYSPKFVRMDSLTLVDRKRPESFVKAEIEINNRLGKIDVDFDASDSYEYIYGYFVFESQTVLKGFNTLNFDCNHGVIDYSSISLYIAGKIDHIGEYPLLSAHMKAAFNENENAYYLGYDSEDFVSGNIAVTTREVIGDKVLVEGNFDVEYTSEFEEVTYPIYIKNGTFKLYIPNND